MTPHNPTDNKVLSEQELWDLIRSILNHEGHLDLRTANIISVIKEQKLAHAEYVIGDDIICDGTCEDSAHAGQKQLVYEQRQRNNLNATSGGNDE